MLQVSGGNIKAELTLNALLRVHTCIVGLLRRMQSGAATLCKKSS